MRIALVNLSLEPGRGSDVVVADLADRLSRKHDVTVYSLRPVPDAVWPCRVIAPERAKGRLAGYRNAFRILRQIAHDADRFDVINCHHALVSLFLPATNLVTTYHGYRGRLNLALGSGIGEAISVLIRRFPVRMALRRGRGVAIVSQSLADEAKASGCSNWRVIYNGVEPLPAQPASAPSHFLYLGRLDPDKSIGKLLAAYEASDVEAPLVLVGDGAEKVQLEARYSGPRFRFMGRLPRTELPSLFASSFAFVTASDFETFCLPVIEAAQFGCPSVGPASGALPEVIQDGVTGRLAAPGCLTAEINALWRQSGDERAAMQKACREWAGRFSWDRSTEEYEAFYASAIGTGSEAGEPARP